MAVLSANAWSQNPDDAPGRGVARISLINGDVSVRRGDSGDYVAAGINAPLVVTDRVVTGLSSRAEIQFDWSNMLRISSNAEVRLAELEFERYIVQLAKGTTTWRVLRDQDAYVEISTPSVSVRPVKKGIYRITVTEDGNSEITVRAGEVEVFTPRGSERLRAGKTMFARGSASDPEFRVASEIPYDDWDRWNERRDKDLLRTQSYNYISRDIYGAEDLDGHGRWVNIPSYGWVWSPNVAPDWAPYRTGRWSWVDYYGWSWVSYDPWGWAPYHYGRWFNYAPYGWCWYPGGIGIRHRWAPAYVAFFGFGVGVNFGWGRVGWVPLAPHDPFYPWWGSRWYGGYRNGGYVNNSVTVVNNVNITNIYRNARVINGTTVIDGDGFRNGRSGTVGRFSEADFRQAGLARGPLPVTPDRASLRVVDHEAVARGLDNRGPERFFSNRQPTHVERVPFEEQRRGVEQVARRAYAGSEGSGVIHPPAGESQRGWQRAAEPAPGAGNPAPGVGRVERSEEPRRGWRRAGEPPASVGGAASGAPATVERGVRDSSGDGVWQRFGSARVAESTPESGRGAASGGSGSSRFGEPQTQHSSEAVRPADSSRRGISSDGFQRFSGRGSDSGSSPAASPRAETPGESSGRGARGYDSFPRARESAPRESAPRESAPMDRGSRMAPDSSPGRSSHSGGGESIRISPPMIRERSGPSGSPGGGGRDGGGGMGRSGGDGGGRGVGGGGASRSGGGDGGGRGAQGGRGR